MLHTGSVFLKTYRLPYSNCHLISDSLLGTHSQYAVKKKRTYKRMIVGKFIYETFDYCNKDFIHYINGKSTQSITKPDQIFEHRQVLLGHCAQIAMYLSAIMITCLRAQNSTDQNAIDLADEFCILAREKIDLHFIQIKNHSRERERIVKERGKNTMSNNYAKILDNNILCLDLPNTKQK